MTTQTIEVRQEHIDNGYCGDGRECPIALALNEQTDILDPCVDKDGVRSGTYSNAILADLPKRAQNFITKYDETGPGAVRPFTFRLAFRKAD